MPCFVFENRRLRGWGSGFGPDNPWNRARQERKEKWKRIFWNLSNVFTLTAIVLKFVVLFCATMKVNKSWWKFKVLRRKKPPGMVIICTFLLFFWSYWTDRITILVNMKAGGSLISRRCPCFKCLPPCKMGQSIQEWTK